MDQKTIQDAAAFVSETIVRARAAGRRRGVDPKALAPLYALAMDDDQVDQVVAVAREVSDREGVDLTVVVREIATAIRQRELHASIGTLSSVVARLNAARASSTGSTSAKATKNGRKAKAPAKPAN